MEVVHAFMTLFGGSQSSPMYFLKAQTKVVVGQREAAMAATRAV
jgi:hypothetical protein